MADVSTSISSYSDGQDNGLSNADAYTRGQDSNLSNVSIYAEGNLFSSGDQPAYTKGNVFLKDNQLAFITGLTSGITSKCFAYLIGITTNSISAYLEGEQGEEMAQVDYIWFKTSDGGATLSKKFKVVQPDYDDGTLEKAEDVKKTIGGGVDHSVGAIYKTWSPVIRVRHTETETDFGDLEDLEYFWSLNNPNATPSNDITFVDHHQTEYTIHFVGKLTKSLLGSQVEGECAWYLYKVNMMRVQ